MARRIRVEASTLIYVSFWWCECGDAVNLHPSYEVGPKNGEMSFGSA